MSTSKLVNFKFLVKVGTLRENVNFVNLMEIENGWSKNSMIFFREDDFHPPYRFFIYSKISYSSRSPPSEIFINYKKFYNNIFS